MGVNIIASAGSDEGIRLLNSMGVTEVHNHHSENYIKDIKQSDVKIDVILEMLANVNLEKDLNIISSEGRVVVSVELDMS